MRSMRAMVSLRRRLFRGAQSERRGAQCSKCTLRPAITPLSRAQRFEAALVAVTKRVERDPMLAGPFRPLTQVSAIPMPTLSSRAFRVGLPLSLGLVVVVLLMHDAQDDSSERVARTTASVVAATAEAIETRSEGRGLHSPVFAESGSHATRANAQPAHLNGALPPDGTPVDQVIDALDTRARAGDARAACRIGSELQRCRRLEHWSTYATRSPSGETPSEQRRAIIAEGQRLIEACSRVDAGVQDDLPRYHLVAALQGNPHSAAQFVGEAVMGGDLVGDPQLYALYRAHAWRLFELAFEAGHPDAIEAWYASVALGNGMERLSPLSGVMPDAWRRPDLAAALAMRAHRPDPGPIEVKDSAEDLALRQEVEQIYQTHFAHSRWQRQYSTGTGLEAAERVLHFLQDAHRLRPCE
jgi:hypothetical protein